MCRCAQLTIALESVPLYRQFTQQIKAAIKPSLVELQNQKNPYLVFKFLFDVINVFYSLTNVFVVCNTGQ